jgi:hypothetical protein
MLLDKVALHLNQLLYAAAGEVEQAVEFSAAERLILGRALHLDQTLAAGHHDVHIDFAT